MPSAPEAGPCAAHAAPPLIVTAVSNNRARTTLEIERIKKSPCRRRRRALHKSSRFSISLVRQRQLCGRSSRASFVQGKKHGGPGIIIAGGGHRGNDRAG